MDMVESIGTSSEMEEQHEKHEKFVERGVFFLLFKGKTKAKKD